jgi:hypothetical protein
MQAGKNACMQEQVKTNHFTTEQVDALIESADAIIAMLQQ